MRKTVVNSLFLMFTGVIIACSIWGPELLTGYRDHAILDEIHIQTVEYEGEGYRFALNSSEKIYILSEALSSQAFSENEQSALTQDQIIDPDYQQVAGAYAFIVKHRDSYEREITNEELYEICNKELNQLKKMEILPDMVGAVEDSAYDAVLYSAIDVLEPRNNVAVWKLSLLSIQNNVNKQNKLIDAYIDADNGRIYEFYARTECEWEDIDPDDIIKKWSDYMELPSPEAYETANPLLEVTPYFKKYIFSGEGDQKTIVTIGFYEGINELFLRVSR